MPIWLFPGQLSLIFKHVSKYVITILIADLAHEPPCTFVLFGVAVWLLLLPVDDVAAIPLGHFHLLVVGHARTSFIEQAKVLEGEADSEEWTSVY